MAVDMNIVDLLLFIRCAILLCQLERPELGTLQGTINMTVSSLHTKLLAHKSSSCSQQLFTTACMACVIFCHKTNHIQSYNLSPSNLCSTTKFKLKTEIKVMSKFSGRPREIITPETLHHTGWSSFFHHHITLYIFVSDCSIQYIKS